MLIPLKLNGVNYKSRLLNQTEVVKGFKGKYFRINFNEHKTKKTLYFPKGKYVINNFTYYQKALSEFGEEIIFKLQSENKNMFYNIFIKGKADNLGHDTFSSKPQENLEPEEICYLKHYKNSDFFYSKKEDCVRLSFPINNNHLPNLRAYFLKQKFQSFYSLSYKEPIIVDGSIEKNISKYDRNATILLYLSESFFLEKNN